jgi:hypothetical protein
MSGIAVVGGFEATIGLMPRHLRRRDEPGEAEPAAADDVAAEPDEDQFARDALPGMRGISETDELRRRIAEAAVPERRGPKPLWIGLGIVALFAAAGLLFPDAFAALLPAVDATP